MGNEGQKGRNVFTVRNFRLVFFGALVSDLGAILYNFAVSFYILEISGNNAFLQGVYLAACGVMMLLFTPVGGVLGDRYNKAKIMYLCDFAKGGIIIAATALMMTFRDSSAHIAVLFAVGITGNAVSGIFSPASGALLPYIVDEDRLQQGNSYFSLKNALQSIIGVVLAGMLYASLPVTALFMIVGVCYVLSGVSEMFIRYRHEPREGKMNIRLMMSDMREGFVYLKSRRAIMTLILVVLFINFFFSPIGSNFLPYFIKTDIASAPSYLFSGSLTPEMWNSVFSVLIGISSLAASLILSVRAQEEKCGEKTAVRLCLVSVVLILMTAAYRIFVEQGLSLNIFLAAMCFVSVMLSALVSFINIPLSTTLMRIVDRDQLSKVTSILSIFSQGLIPIASVLAGIVLQYLGSTALLVMCSAGFVCAALCLMFSKEKKNI